MEAYNKSQHTHTNDATIIIAALTPIMIYNTFSLFGKGVAVACTQSLFAKVGAPQWHLSGVYAAIHTPSHS